MRRALADGSGATIPEYGLVVIGVLALGGVIMRLYTDQLLAMVKMIGEAFEVFP
ncbi:hypothetical protein ACT6QH_11690 [Xanthobacter sp. TB0139]|uniref:hypothetical protein n=1 Tax=Xanthobacter sp. TB0139 TaxID=3459178 RepID=UPI00403A7377